MEPPEFNLVDEPWLPCRNRDGSLVALGIRDALLRSGELAELRDSSPLTTAALLRLLLAVLYAAHGRDWTNGRRAEMWRQGGWDTKRIEEYLALWRGRFNLLDRQFPFYQDGSFELPQPVTVARLAPELASGNNPTLFDHTMDAQPPALDLPTCARWTVTYQAFTLGGGQGATSARYGKHPNLRHAPAALGAQALLRGETLFQTLLLNMVPYTHLHPFPSGKDDRPLWERDEFPCPKEQGPPGYLAYLTWPIRCLRLRAEELEHGWGVRRADIAQGPYFAAGTGLRDPFFALRFSSANEPMPVRLSAARSLWRDSHSLFGMSESAAPTKGSADAAIVPRPLVIAQAESLEADAGQIPLSCLIVGLDFDQAKINLWRAEELPVPWQLLKDADRVDSLRDAVQDAEQIGRALKGALVRLAQTLLKPADSSKADKAQAQELARGWGAEAEYWPALEGPFRTFLRELADGPDEAVRNWQTAAIQAGNRAFELAEQQAGSGARELRARVEARSVFRRSTWKWQPLARTSAVQEEEPEDDGPA